ncbi:MAG: HupE/UreJ family protein [Myxococcales bacterium]|nr:HupE/UreJ family protein [Myxococcales bacterium]
MIRRGFLAFLLGLPLWMSSASAFAHWTEPKYLDLERTSDSIRINVRASFDGLLDALSLQSKDELQTHKNLITKILVGDFQVGYRTKDSFVPCSKTYKVAELPMEIHKRVSAQADFECPYSAEKLVLKENSTSNMHKTFVHIVDEDVPTGYILSGAQREIVLSNAQNSVVQVASHFLMQGAFHLMMGYDHLLFILILILNVGRLVREQGWWSTLIATISIVSAFTVGHSISLICSTLNIINLPAGPIEVFIVASIAVVAGLNVAFPRATNGRVSLALVFGLIHGFGFAGALGELGLPSSHMVVALASFNLGIEFAQVVLVGLFLLPLAKMAISRMYRPVIEVGGSVVIGCIALVWMTERLVSLI